MPVFLNTAAPDFETAFAAFLGTKRESDTDVLDTVNGIIADVRARGDAAVIELTSKFDRLDLTPETLAFSKAEIDAAIATVPAAERDALELAAARIRTYHEKQLPDDARWTDESGADLGWRWSAVSSAGLYVPGGLASYPSSVLMNAIPAAVAGVENLVICAPTPDGKVNPLVLLAARLSSVETVYRIGGAQAIAAMAYGTGTIDPVDKITGPGNAFVAVAKRQGFGQVGIDMIAGPSEILVIADKDNNPDWLALDLLSQAEHDESAQSILITDDEEFGKTVKYIGFTFVMAIILVYMVLASQFNSFIQPLIIMVAQPLAIVGGVFALWLLDHSLNIFSMVGLVLLMGLVAKNSILLVDMTNQLREKGKGINEAIKEACPLRLRPVLMTSFTVILALFPASLGIGAGADTNGPLAVAVIGGMISSTLLTLVVVPAVYSLVENGLERTKQWKFFHRDKKGE